VAGGGERKETVKKGRRPESQRSKIKGRFCAGLNHRAKLSVLVTVDDGTEHFFSLRGLPDNDEGKIRFDHVARSELRLDLGQFYEFAIRRASLREKVLWAMRATDPAARIAVCIAVWSGIVAVIGLIGLWPVIKEFATGISLFEP
jgi:hypothetical protein